MKVNLRNRSVFGFVIPDMVKGPWADIASGIRQTAQRDGHGVCVPLCWDNPAAVLRHPSVFARLCAEADIDGVFLRAFPDRKDTRRVLSALRREKIPIALLRVNDESPVGGAGFDVVTLRNEGRISPRVALRLGSVACHALLQRIAKPSVPFIDLVLDGCD